MNDTPHDPLSAADWQHVHDEAQSALHPDVAALRAEFDARVAAYREALLPGSYEQILAVAANLGSFIYSNCDAITFRPTTPAPTEDAPR